MVVTTVKPWYQSKTVWVNVLVSAVAVLSYLADGLGTGALNLPFTITPEGIAFAIGLANLILRFMTYQPIRTKAG